LGSIKVIAIRKINVQYRNVFPYYDKKSLLANYKIIKMTTV